MHRWSFVCFLLFCCNYVAAQQMKDVAMFKGNSQLTGVYDEKAVYHVTGVKFTFKTGGAIRSTPAIYHGVVYFGSSDGVLYAVDAQSGKELWQFSSGSPLNSSPAVSDGKVWFVNGENILYCLNVSDGKENWKFKMEPNLDRQNYWDYYYSSPNIHDHFLYIGGGDGYLYCFDTQTKTMQWKYNAGARIRSTPAVENNSVVFGTMSGYIVSVNKNTGEQQWKYATQGSNYKFYDVENDRTAVFCSPAADDGVATVGARDGFLYTLDLATGQLKWKFDHQGSWVLSTAIKDGKAYIGSGSALFIQCVDLETGKEQWRFKTISANFSSITITGDLLYFGDFAGNIYALDIHTGKEKWCFPLGNRSLSTPVVSNGIVYCSSDDGVLYALQGSTSPDTSTIHARKAVYYEGLKTDTAFSWFTNGADEWLKNYLVTSGYELLNTARLKEFMLEETQSKSRSVIVFADNKIPPSVLNTSRGNSIIRNYLDQGGKVVFLAPNPAAYKTDSVTGVLDTVDFSLAEKAFGIKFPPFNEMMGYYDFTLTDEGRKCGLLNFGVGASGVDPSEVTSVLALNDYGLASEWIKNYGGPPGTGLLQLAVPRFAIGEAIFPLKAAIEQGICW